MDQTQQKDFKLYKYGSSNQDSDSDFRESSTEMKKESPKHNKDENLNDYFDLSKKLN